MSLEAIVNSISYRRLLTGNLGYAEDYRIPMRNENKKTMNKKHKEKEEKKKKKYDNESSDEPT